MPWPSGIGADQVLITVILKRPSPHRLLFGKQAVADEESFRFYRESVSNYRLALSEAHLKIGTGLG
jgi:hypothetical protein